MTLMSAHKEDGAAGPGVVNGGGSVQAAGGSANSLRPGVTELLIVRHGETAWNADSRVQGQIDIELNETGRIQARNLAQALLRSGIADRIDAVVSSDLLRASQTADEIASVCKNVKRSFDPDLREVHFGEFQGTSSKENPELKMRRERVHKGWKRGEFKHRHPGGGESGVNVIERGMRGLRTAAGCGSCVVVAAHGGVIKWSAVGAELTGGKLEIGNIFDSVPDPFAQEEKEVAESDADETKGQVRVAGHGEEGLPASEEMQAAMKTERVKALLSTPITNCCVSTVLYDHATGELTPVRWYEDMSGSAGKDDNNI